jgi:hypothetical protein
MSKVISFRLDENNPRERLVLETIKTHQLDGYSIRSTIVEAFMYQNNQSDESHQRVLAELNDTLFQLRQMLDQFNRAGKINDQVPLCPKLTDDLFDSIKNAAKSGIRL